MPKESISLRIGEGYNFGDGMSCTDNLFSADNCSVWIDENSYYDLIAFLDAGKPGTTKLTYCAQDLLGNVSQKDVQVTLKGYEAGHLEALARDAFRCVNEYRVQHGLAELVWSDSVYENAKIRAEEIVGVFSHTRPDGSHCTSVFGDLVGKCYLGENIASGYPDGQSVADGWYDSEGHRENMLLTAYTEGAIACYQAENGKYYWCQLFLGR